MNIRAKYSNPKCAAFNVEKSVAVGLLTGYRASSDRVKCPECGKLMKTTKTANPSAVRSTGRRITGRPSTGRRKPATRTSRRANRRNSGRR
jgi:hypothetical protein